MAVHIDLRDLRYFEAIAELGHIGRAAVRLHLTQPALTRCVRRLEEMFGTDLFERVGRGIRLTPAGEALLVRARRLHVAADETARQMVDFARGDSGHIRVGLVPTAAQFVLAASRSHPILRRRRRIRINDLLQYRWVLAPASVESRQGWTGRSMRAGSSDHCRRSR